MGSFQSQPKKARPLKKAETTGSARPMSNSTKWAEVDGNMGGLNVMFTWFHACCLGGGKKEEDVSPGSLFLCVVLVQLLHDVRVVKRLLGALGVTWVEEADFAVTIVLQKAFPEVVILWNLFEV